MIAQERVFTRNLLKVKASRIRDYGQRKKISCGNKKPAWARVIHEFSGLDDIVLEQELDRRRDLSWLLDDQPLVARAFARAQVDR